VPRGHLASSTLRQSEISVSLPRAGVPPPPPPFPRLTLPPPPARSTDDKAAKLAAVESDVAEAEALIRRMDLEARPPALLEFKSFSAGTFQPFVPIPETSFELCPPLLLPLLLHLWLLMLVLLSCSRWWHWWCWCFVRL